MNWRFAVIRGGLGVSAARETTFVPSCDVPLERVVVHHFGGNDATNVERDRASPFAAKVSDGGNIIPNTQHIGCEFQRKRAFRWCAEEHFDGVKLRLGRECGPRFLHVSTNQARRSGFWQSVSLLSRSCLVRPVKQVPCIGNRLRSRRPRRRRHLVQPRQRRPPRLERRSQRPDCLRPHIPSAALYMSRIASSSAMSSLSRLRRAMTLRMTLVS